MSNKLAKTNKPELSFTPEQTQLIKNVMAVGATDDELKLFLYQAKRTGLDPLARQIYFMKRKYKDKNGNWLEKATIQTSIDGFRVIAERSGSYAGQDEPKFDPEPSVSPNKCTITVYRFDKQGTRYPASHGVAYWSEYCPPEGQNFMWKKMPHTMLSKVAEALALRKAFPQDLSGLYASEEMDQAKIEDITPLKKKLPLTKGKRIHAILNELGASHEKSKEFLKSKFGVDSHNDLTEKQADDYIKALEDKLDSKIHNKQHGKPMDEIVNPDIVNF